MTFYYIINQLSINYGLLFSFVLVDLYVFDEPFYDFFVGMVIIFNVFVELFAQG